MASSAGFEESSRAKAFGGFVHRGSHNSRITNCRMNFSVYLPPQAASQRVPVLYWLSGLTCTDENFLTKAGALRVAAEVGVALVMPDTSPRGAGIEGEAESWDFGVGAGFYLNATQDKWRTHYNMYDYIVKELPELVNATFPARSDAVSIFGHSMGGHGALVIGMRNPDKYRSVSAFSPIANPCDCAWGHKAFSGYLGEDREAWKAYDATEIAKSYDGPERRILVDQGTADGFLEKQLKPERLKEACDHNPKLRCELRMQDGYDHSYFFISTFIEDHIRFHAAALQASA